VLKKFNDSDIDILMGIWKRAYMDANKKVNNDDLTRAYTEIRDILLDASSNTTIYTEDDCIEGFITVDEKNKIVIIYVDKKIRREGIGSMLVDSCKKKYDSLKVSFNKQDMIYKSFFEKNEFEKQGEDSDLLEDTYEWCAGKEDKVNIIFFDNDLNEELFNSKILNVKKIHIKEILENDKELKSVKNYMKVRKVIENSFGKKTLLYLNYGNYNDVLDDIIKEIVKIEKANFAVVVSEPLIIENPKMEIYLEKIEKSYSNYKVHKIDTMENIEKDISVNKILDEKMKVIIRQIEKVAENM